MINILKASAGSGKTFRLAKTYISLLLDSEDRYAYRHILAVTFTNKATAEMKGRILKELYILARTPEESGYFEDFRTRYGDAAKIGRKAERILQDILHDYSAFSISTIDRFFQQTLKAFAREIGQFSSYQVELDKDSLVRESVDRILDSLTEEDGALIRWLTDSVMEEIERGGRYSLENKLYDMAFRLRSDEHREVVEEHGIDEKKTYSKENLSVIGRKCRALINGYEQEVREASLRIGRLLDEAGVWPEDFFKGFMKGIVRYADTRDRIEAPSAAVLARLGERDAWFAKTKKNCLSSLGGDFDAAVADFVALFGPEYRVYNTARTISGQIYSLGIASELQSEFEALMKEKNVLSIDDSNTILKKIIGGSDAPFIYEKLGVRYEHFLLDEFQDTSIIQWENFRPLLAESNSWHRDNLIVGDVKQSIYRWRGSDWNLLNSSVKEAFPDSDDSESLRANWRSCRNIVEFNNGFFAFASGILDAKAGGGLVAQVYSDVAQEVRGKYGDGHVQCTFCPKENEYEEVLASVRRAVENGADYGQIAVLVRTNIIGAAVASYLVAQGVPVVSDDSLRVKSSLTVRRLTSLLSYIANPADKVGGFLAESLGMEQPGDWHSLEDLCEILIRGLRKVDETVVDNEVLYIQSFMDVISDWVSVNGNNLTGFLKDWADSDPAISSPDDSKAVRIMTIHKSKGLEFPYVIIPFAEGVGLFKGSEHWVCPDFRGTELEGVAEGVYSVGLSGASSDTLFEEEYRKELLLQYIDNINTFYVALTRAGMSLHIIAGTPSKKCVAAADKHDAGFDFKDFSQILYYYLRTAAQEHGLAGMDAGDGNGAWEKGRFFDFRTLEPNRETETIESGFPSWPRGRLHIKAEARDFFADDGTSGVDASVRIKGIVLHKILSRVICPSDLESSVLQALDAGDIEQDHFGEILELLRSKIDFAASRGWFPEDGSRVLNEVSIASPDGRVRRPDRVVITGDSVKIVDYKFGEEKDEYERQVGRYAALFRAMGYRNVSAALWYVISDKIVDVK